MAVNFSFLNDDSFRYLKDKLTTSSFSLSYLNDRYTPDNLNGWRAEARRFIADKLLFSPEEVPLNEEIVEEEDFGEYTRQKICFDSAPGCRVPAYLLIPKGLNKPAPAVIVLHDHGGMQYWGKEKVVEHKHGHDVLEKFIDRAYDGKPPASELAKRGYVTLVTDSLFFGERRLKLEAIDEFRQRLERHEFESPSYIAEYNDIQFDIIESELNKAFVYAGWTCAGARLHDDRRSIDLLFGRPEVDPVRIGCIGLSMGGHRAAWLGAMDDRIRCAAVICWMARHQDMIEHKIANIHWMWSVPGIHDALDYPDIVSLSVPKPLLVCHGTRDHLFPHQTGQKAIETVSRVYEKAGFPSRFTAHYYDSDHAFNSDMQADAYSWLDMQLKPE